MSFLEDAWDAVAGAVGGAVGGALDVAGDVFESLPGGVEVSGALKDAVNGPLRDFANSDVGKVVLRSIATALYAPIAGALYAVPFGVQLATVAWTLPGLLRGEDFDEAWMLEFRWRAEKTAEVLGPGILDAFGDQVKSALEDLAAKFGLGAYASIVAEELAARLGIRVDVAQFAIDLWNRTDTTAGRDAFDLITGRRITRVQRGARQAFDPTRTTVEGRAATAYTVGKAQGAFSVATTPTAFTSTAYRAPSMFVPTASSGGSMATSSSSSTSSRDLLVAVALVAGAAALVYWAREDR